MSWVARVVLIIVGVMIVLVGRAAWGLEDVYGGQSGAEGYQLGHLTNGQVEVRQIAWNHLEGEAKANYDVAAIGDDRYAVVFVEGGAVQFTGTDTEVAVWLDEQGPRIFVGTQREVEAYVADARSERRNFLVPALIIAAGIGLVIVALIPGRRQGTQDKLTPVAPVA